MAHILVIDDEADVRRIMRRHLETAGHQVVEAGDGKGGLNVYRENPVDLVITDLFMPEKDGLETIRELRRTYKDSRILVVTGIQPGGPFDFRAHAVLLGAQRTLTKPFTREELLDAVRDMLAIEPGAARDRRGES